ncbi:hypothetical protein, partial [Mycobacterium tuberculosis]|uniref:hypothetical protein n=1 Tax=Mycobacterium tuberculosis TaxID=1773 RepID=UPI001F1DD455
GSATEKGGNRDGAGNGGRTPKHAQRRASDRDKETRSRDSDRGRRDDSRTADRRQRTAPGGEALGRAREGRRRRR